MNSPLFSNSLVDSVQVDGSITTILDADNDTLVSSKHVYIILRNRSASDNIWLSVGSEDPEEGKGKELRPGEEWTLDADNYTTAVIKGIAASGKTVDVATFVGVL